MKTTLIDDDDEDVDGEYIDVHGPNAPATFGWILKIKVIFAGKISKSFGIFGKLALELEKLKMISIWYS